MDKKEKEVELLSFGYLYGLPEQADMVLDVRGLKNPFYEPQLKALTGRDKAVQDYIFAFPESRDYLEKAMALVNLHLQLWEKGHYPTVCIAVGCTGGRHRSVAMVLAMAQRLEAGGWRVTVRHRQID